MDPDPAAINALLELAASEPVGLLLRTNDQQRAKARLAAARKASPNPVVQDLQIRNAPGGFVALVHPGKVRLRGRGPGTGANGGTPAEEG